MGRSPPGHSPSSANIGRSISGLGFYCGRIIDARTGQPPPKLHRREPRSFSRSLGIARTGPSGSGKTSGTSAPSMILGRKSLTRTTGGAIGLAHGLPRSSRASSRPSMDDPVWNRKKMACSCGQYGTRGSGGRRSPPGRSAPGVAGPRRVEGIARHSLSQEHADPVFLSCQADRPAHVRTGCPGRNGASGNPLAREAVPRSGSRAGGKWGRR